MKSKIVTNTYLLMSAAILTMVLTLPAEAQYVNMRFSGTAGNSVITNLLAANTNNAEYNLAGKGALGPFTLRLVNTEPNSPSTTPPATCSGPTKLYANVDTGVGIFRFEDGSLLYVHVTGGSDCIDFVAGQALCIRYLQVTKGTGRFANASGALTLTETVIPLLADISGMPVFFAATGGVKGTISGATQEQDQDNDQ